MIRSGHWTRAPEESPEVRLAWTILAVVMGTGVAALIAAWGMT